MSVQLRDGAHCGLGRSSRVLTHFLVQVFQARKGVIEAAGFGERKVGDYFTDETSLNT